MLSETRYVNTNQCLLDFANAHALCQTSPKSPDQAAVVYCLACAAALHTMACFVCWLIYPAWAILCALGPLWAAVVGLSYKPVVSDTTAYGQLAVWLRWWSAIHLAVGAMFYGKLCFHAWREFRTVDRDATKAGYVELLKRR